MRSSTTRLGRRPARRRSAVRAAFRRPKAPPILFFIKEDGGVCPAPEHAIDPTVSLAEACRITGSSASNLTKYHRLIAWVAHEHMRTGGWDHLNAVVAAIVGGGHVPHI